MDDTKNSDHQGCEQEKEPAATGDFPTSKAIKPQQGGSKPDSFWDELESIAEQPSVQTVSDDFFAGNDANSSGTRIRNAGAGNPHALADGPTSSETPQVDGPLQGNSSSTTAHETTGAFSALNAEDATLLLKLLRERAGECGQQKQGNGKPMGKKSWRRRHPVWFGFFIVLLLIVAGLLLAKGASRLDSMGVLASPRLGVLKVEGMIMDSTPALEWCARLEKDSSIKGVLVRINSPGGAVVPSQEIYAAVQRLAQKKPVVVSMGAVAASGGYYIALGGDFIVAGPSTLTGSIGVRMELAEAKQLLDTIGIHPQGLNSGSLKEAGTFYRPMRADEKLYLQGLVDDMYLAFIEDVSKSRKLSLATVRNFADGRAYTGRQALSLKLVDALGDADFALGELKRRVGMSRSGDVDLVVGPQEQRSLLFRLFSSAIEDFVKAKAEAQGGMPGFYY